MNRSANNVQTSRVKFDKRGVNWTETCAVLNTGHLIATVNREAALDVQPEYGQLEATVNIEKGWLEGIDKTVMLPAPRRDLPDVQFNIGQKSSTYTFDQRFAPKLIKSTDKKSVRARSTEYSGDFKLHLNPRGKVMFRSNSDHGQVDEVDAGEYFEDEPHIIGNCHYKIRY